MDIIIQDVDGVKELLDAGVKSPISKSVTRIANYLRNQAKKNVKKAVYERVVTWKRTGQLQQSIATNKIDSLSSEVLVGAEYGRYVEEGTKARTITAKGKGLIMPVEQLTSMNVKDKKRISKDGKYFFLGKTVKYKGSKPYPFWYPAIQTTSEKIPEIVSAEIDKYWQKQNQ
jgi:hypothetical protein